MTLFSSLYTTSLGTLHNPWRSCYSVPDSGVKEKIAIAVDSPQGVSEVQSSCRYYRFIDVLTLAPQNLDHRPVLNLPAMRDQKFQELLVNVEAAKVSSESATTIQKKEMTPQPTLDNLAQALEQQAPFRQFIKRHAATPKPSPALIASIKERIRIQGLHD